MFKKIFAIATVMCVIPMMANAATKWQLGTRAMSQGGVINSTNMTGQTVANGSIFKQYTTTNRALQNVTVTANGGFKISKISNNGIISVPASSPITITPAASGNTTIQATFARLPYNISAVATSGGTVDKTAYPVVYAGIQSPAKSFVFTPNPGQAVAGVVVTGAGAVSQNLNATTGLPVTLPAAVGVKVKTNITTVGSANITVAATFTSNPYTNPVPSSAAQCDACHASQGVGVGVYNNWSTISIHKPNSVSCANCHVGADAGGHPGNPSCTGCHSGYNAAEVSPTAACYGCHQPLGDTVTDPHRFQVANKTFGCVDCHAAEINHPGNTLSASQNAGVRQIAGPGGEFSRNSHHISSGTPTNEQCAMCHLEGMTDPDNPTKVIPDENYHLVNGTIHLRNGNVGIQDATVEYNWNPASPNHANMDKFCMSCHNAAGPVSAIAALGTAIPAGATVAKPFGINVTNGYDQLIRPAVVAVYEQFDINNVAHHAVRGAKYSLRTRNAAFSNNSSAASPGVRKTIYDAGLFVATYTPLGASLSVADNSTLHCGDCHTVGQFKAGSTINAAGQPTTQVIGAHGSVNEYMLRTSTGADTLHHQSDNPSASAGPEDGTYVCFLCHAQTEEETGGYNAMGFHGGIEGANTSYCNGRAAESVGLVGYGGSFKTTYDANGVKVGQTRLPNITGTNSGGNVFGYSCAHCHNGGQNNTFGGIHGSNATYKSYSANGLDASATNSVYTIVQKKPFRFTGGLSLRYQGGGDAAKWEKKSLAKANREGCYNQSTTANSPATKIKLWGPATPAHLDSTGATDDTPTQPTGGVTGTWGSCSHHSGTTTGGSGTAPTRVGVQRPLFY